jgi:hypothetical protein
MYKLVNNMFGGEPTCVIKLPSTTIPFDPANTDYQVYLKWLAEGNTPEPADEPE